MVTKKVTPSKSVGSFNWDQWQGMFTEAIESWPVVAGRYAAIFLLGLMLQLSGVLLMIFVFSGLLGGMSGIENIIANLEVGTLPSLSVLWTAGLVFIAWTAWAIVVGSLSKVAHLALIRDHVKRTKNPAGVIDLMFQEGWQRCWAYMWLGLKVFVIIAWPVLLVGLLGGGWWWAQSTLWLDGSDVPGALRFLSEGITAGLMFGALLVAAMVYLIYRSVTLFFVMNVFIYTGKDTVTSMTKTQKITAGAWWYVFLNWLLFFCMLYAASIALELVGAVDPTGIINLLAFLVSVFIFAPITLLFQYALMLQTAKNQSVKL